MKYIPLFSLIVFGAFISCEKQALIEPEQHAEETFFYINAGINDAVTKAEFTTNSGLYWNDHDRVGLVRQDNNSETIVSAEATITNEYRTATFGIASTQLTSGVKYRPYYPEYENGETGGWATDWNHAGWYVNAVQKQYNSGKLENGRFFLWGTQDIDYSTENQDINTYFNLAGTVICFKVYGGSDGEETISSVKIEQTNDLSSTVNIVSGSYYSNDTGSSSDASRFSVTVTISGYTEYANRDKSTANGIYAIIIPNHNYEAVEPYTRHGNTYTYTVETNKKTYTFVSAKEKIYENKYIYEMPLNLSKATSTVAK